MVIGDVMTDAYVFGKVDRISPEAPVPVVHITGRENRPGGAANVAINIKSLGAQPLLCSVTGDDDAGYLFATLLEQENISTSGIFRIPGRKTTVKTRVIGNNHQLVRVDDETIEELQGRDQQEFIDRCCELMRKEHPGVVIFEDYDKGVLTADIIKALVQQASELNIPTAVDPKRKNFGKYNNVTLFKPNLHELKSGLGVAFDKPDAESLEKLVKPFMKDHSIESIMVTLSEAGVFITGPGGPLLIPAHVRNISDVSGAGDTVISVAALCLALGTHASTIAGLSNLAGGLVCEEVGVVPVNRERLLHEASRISLFSDRVKS